jgi:hypothetical protein
MTVYKIELLVINFDNLSEVDIKQVIENVNYPNDCINPTVMKITGQEIGEWNDDNPLNNSNTMAKEYDRLFTGG